MKDNVFWLVVKRVSPDTRQKNGMLNPMTTGGASSSSDNKDVSMTDEGGAAKRIKESEVTGVADAAVPPTPVMPTEEEIAAHNVSHIPMRSWCKICVGSKADDAPHQRVKNMSRVPLIQADYFYMWAESDEDKATVLGITDCESDALGAAMLKDEVPETYAVYFMKNTLDFWGRTKIAFRMDQEPAIMKLTSELKKQRAPLETLLEHAPRHSHQSVGEAEGGNKRLQGQIGAICMSVEEHYQQKVTKDHKLLPWAVRHSGFLLNRYQVHAHGKTSYDFLKNGSYKGEVVEFAESVWVKYVKQEAKLESRWGSGIWLGKIDTSDEHLVGTATGIERARAIRRKPL